MVSEKKFWLKLFLVLTVLYLFLMMYRYFSYWGIGVTFAMLFLTTLIIALGALVSFLLARKWQVYEINTLGPRPTDNEFPEIRG